MKYRILVYYGTCEGWQFQDEEFTSVDEAVKAAIKVSYGNKFYIVQIIDWEAK